MEAKRQKYLKFLFKNSKENVEQMSEEVFYNLYDAYKFGDLNDQHWSDFILYGLKNGYVLPGDEDILNYMEANNL